MNAQQIAFSFRVKQPPRNAPNTDLIGRSYKGMQVIGDAKSVTLNDIALPSIILP